MSDMTRASSKAGDVGQAARIDIRQEYGWRHVERRGISLWTKGYGCVGDQDRLLRKIAGLGASPSAGSIDALLSGLGGHFALAASGPGWVLAAVDRVRSIPLAYAEGPDGWVVDDQAERLRSRLCLDAIDRDAALSIAMAGYTVDTGTLYSGLEQLGPGEFVLFTGKAASARQRYYTYRPWRADKPAYDAGKARKALAETTLEIIDEMMRSVGDRILAVPLSAGRDSRLIVSAARHLGYRNVRTFAYGLKGNHEAKTSREIAQRLGYDWHFVATNPRFMQRYYASEGWKDYLRFSDSHQSVPFVQDLPQVQQLKSEGYIPADAVMCNGNSGDYISGAHVVPPMDEVPSGLSAKARRARIVSTLCMKHFALWKSLYTPENCARIEKLLDGSLRRAGVSLTKPENDYGIYEYAEFQDRQCKFVISGQRIYEFLGHDWRLPLWDRRLIDAFEMVPLDGKSGQRLYLEMLDEQDWGGVWKNLPVNRRTIKPNWIRPLRWIAKAAHAPVGKKAWHRFERRYFQYWMEVGSQTAIRPYAIVARDRRDARHGISWLAEDYLAMHRLKMNDVGLALDG